MKKCTYLFGAGASCNCLPIYSNFNQRFEDFYKFIKDYTKPLQTKSRKSKESLIKELEFYKTELHFHSTPDTYAKRIFHTEPEEKLNSFKLVLILFFIYEQMQAFSSDSTINLDTNIEKQSFDKRYDAFIAALLKPIPRKIEFIENIKILTWNYDLQFEIAYMQYDRQMGLYKAQEELQSFPRLREDNKSYQIDAQRISIFHLNGIAYFKNLGNESFDGQIGRFISEKEYLGNYIFSVYDRMKEDGLPFTTSNFSFAWESVNDSFKITNPTLKMALNDTSKTEVLIINGYSFPIFNRAIDVELIENMKDLKEIYIQDKYSANNIKQILESFVPNRLKGKIFDLGFYNQFYIPEMFKKETQSNKFVIATNRSSQNRY